MDENSTETSQRSTARVLELDPSAHEEVEMADQLNNGFIFREDNFTESGQNSEVKASFELLGDIDGDSTETSDRSSELIMELDPSVLTVEVETESQLQDGFTSRENNLLIRESGKDSEANSSSGLLGEVNGGSTGTSHQTLPNTVLELDSANLTEGDMDNKSKQGFTSRKGSSQSDVSGLHPIVHALSSHHYKKHGSHDQGHSEQQFLDRYPQAMEVSEHHNQHGSQDLSVDLEHISTAHILAADGSKTLMRFRRKSSKRVLEKEDITELLNSEEDNNVIPSLLFRMRTKRKTLKERKHDLEEEKNEEAPVTEQREISFPTKYQDMQEGDMSIGNFAELFRTSTLRRVRKIAEWSKPKKLEQFVKETREFISKFNFWVTSFKVIEGKFGTAVMSFFRFIRWLLFLNVFLMLIMICVITLPFIAMGPWSFTSTIPEPSNSSFHGQALICSTEYENYSHQIFNKESKFEQVLDVLQGTGWMERTVLFYGSYYNKTYVDNNGKPAIYNIGLAYILAVGACFIITLMLLVKNSAKTVKTTFGIDKPGAAYTNRVLAGWDYALASRKAVKVKQATLYSAFQTCLLEDVLTHKRMNRTSKEQGIIILYRVFVNICVLAILAGSLYLVYFTTDKLLQLQEKDLSGIVALIVHFLPYLTITVFNFLLPIIFQKLVWLEDYSAAFALNITLARSIILRLASLAVLIVSLYRLLIINAQPEDGLCGNRLWNKTTKFAKGSIKCWETYVGQQIYKLVLLDLILEAGIIFFIHLPRRLLYKNLSRKAKIIENIGQQDFDLPQNVIDIIYSQTLCWLGLFFSPLIPLITFIKCFLFFYLRKWTLLKNCTMTEQLYHTTGSHSLFMFVLLFSFVLATVPVGYMISSISPSQSCGPFRVYSSSKYDMFTALSNEVLEWPTVLRDVLFFIGSVGFFIPAIILMCLLIYYYWLLGQGYKKREKILCEQIKMVAKDKQFLLARLNEVWMGKGRIPKDLLYGELEKGTRKTGCPLLRFKDICKRDMKSAAIDT